MQRAPGTVGVVGGGQLARMLAEAASALGVRVVVLAADPADPAAEVSAECLVGDPGDPDALGALAARCDVVTFDHEQVDLARLEALEAGGVTVRPGTATLAIAVDKAAMRHRLAQAGLPGPAYAVLGPADGAEVVEAFAAEHGWPVVVKAARGGYDGRGVWPVADAAAARRALSEARGLPLLVEAQVAIEREVAVVVARRPSGQAVAWPPVETAQVEGMCREVLFPGHVDPDLAGRATALAHAVAEEAGSVGVLAVELFVAGDEVLVNEVAARPHNSAHWTIEGAVTSQFENHLRAVLDLPLGDPSPTAPHVASVNVVGAPDGTTPAGALGRALAVEGAHVHLYGKAARPGRKLGHVTVRGGDPEEVRRRAWRAARALGTPLPPAIAAALGCGG